MGIFNIMVMIYARGSELTPAVAFLKQIAKCLSWSFFYWFAKQWAKATLLKP
jgi:hypothetical protein